MFNLKSFKTIVIMILTATSLTAGAQKSGLTMAKLEKGLSNLRMKIEQTADYSTKLEILESFHLALQKEIDALADMNTQDNVYWRAVNLDVFVTDMIDTPCQDLTKKMARADFSMVDNEQTGPSEDTKKAIDLVSVVCK